MAKRIMYTFGFPNGRQVRHPHQRLTDARAERVLERNEQRGERPLRHAPSCARGKQQLEKRRVGIEERERRQLNPQLAVKQRVSDEGAAREQLLVCARLWCHRI